MHFMIDLETLSTATDAAIIQIGVQAFDPKELGVRYEGLLIRVDGQSCLDLGMKVDWSTIHWWLSQSEAARNSLTSTTTLRSTLSAALIDVIEYIGRYNAPATVWSNGAAFDIPILENAFKRLDMVAPWSYNKVMDVRTMKFLAPDVPRVEPLTAHDALSDAQAQVVWVQRMYRALKGQTPLGLLWDSLSYHDWTHMMSDDPTKSREGAQKQRNLKARAEALGEEGINLFEAYRASVWEQKAVPDRPWGK